MDEDKQVVGCMVFVVIVMVALAASVLVGHFFGLDIGLVTLLLIMAIVLFWMACVAYKNDGDGK